MNTPTNRLLMEVLRILPKREVMITEFQPTQINILHFFTVQSRASKQKNCIGMPSLCDLIILPYLLTGSLFLMLAFLTPVYSKDTSEPLYWVIPVVKGGVSEDLGCFQELPPLRHGPFPFLHFSTCGFQTALWVL